MTDISNKGWTLVINKKKKNEQIQNENINRSDLLCCMKSDHDDKCKLCHDLNNWNPKICKYKKNCLKSESCIFFHKNYESKSDYLKRCFTFDNSYYQKHKDEYNLIFFNE